MKSTLKLTFAIFAVAAVIFTGCKKGGSDVANTTKNTIDATTAAKRIAVAFYNSFTGKYGGANANGGIQVPQSSSNRLKINRLDPYCSCSYIQPYCGLTLDSLDNFTYNVGDTVKNVDSKFKFIYTCSSTDLDGYVLTDSITYTDHGPLFINKYLIAQNYIVNKAADDFSLAVMQGTMGNRFVEKILDGSGATTDTKNNHTEYAFSNIKIKTDGSGIVSGTVTFSAVLSEVITGGDTLNGSFTGVMTFLGNNKANIAVTYQGQTDSFVIDLATFDATKVNQCGCNP